MLLYGRGTENRTLIYGLKARYFAVKLYPHDLATLVTTHDNSPFKNLVLLTRIELVFHPYQGCVMPLYYKSDWCRHVNSNHGPFAYQANALTN